MSTATHTPSTNGQAQPGWMAEVDADLAQQKKRGRKLKPATVRRMLRCIDPVRVFDEGGDVGNECLKETGRALHVYGLPFSLYSEWLNRIDWWTSSFEAQAKDYWLQGCPEGLGNRELEQILGEELHKAGWLWTEKNKLISGSAKNVRLALSFIPAAPGVRFNEFTSKVEVDGEGLNNSTLSMLKELIEAEFDYVPTVEAIVQGLDNLGAGDSYHPVRDWLGSLKWDGQARLSNLPEKFGIENPTDYQKQALRLIFRGIVSRVHNPGAQFDYMVVFRSDRQGTGKTTAWRIISKGYMAKFKFHKFDTEKKLIEQSEGSLVLLNEELDGFGKQEVETVKSEITETVDKARPAYGRMVETRPRQFIMGGTSNPSEFLSDTENRRFVVVECGDIDLEWLGQNVDQLYAETIACHGTEEKHVFLPDHLWPVQEADNEKYRIVSPVEEVLNMWLPRDGNRTVAATTVQEKMQSAGLGSIDPRQIAKPLRAMGWQRKQRRHPVSSKPVWVWVLGTGSFGSWITD